MTPNQLEQNSKDYTFQGTTWDRVFLYLLNQVAGGTLTATQVLQNSAMFNIEGTSWDKAVLYLLNLIAATGQTPNQLQAASAMYTFQGTDFDRLSIYLLDQIAGNGPTPPPTDSIFTWEPTSLSSEQFWSQMGFFAYDNASSLVGVTALVYNGVTNREGIDIEHAPDLVSFAAPNLTAFTDGSYLEIDGCLLLTSLNFSALITAQDISLRTNASLTSIDFSSLSVIEGNFNIGSNAAITSVDFPSLTECYYFSVSDNAALASIGLGSLVTANSTFTISGDAITTMDLSSIESFGGAVSVYFYPLLTSITFHAAPIFAGNLNFSHNALSIAEVNSILATCVAATTDGSTPWIGDLQLASQTPPAPPSGQGALDVITLTGRGATVTTD